MAKEFYGFFDSTAEDVREYTETDMARFIRTLAGSGVRDGQSLKTETADTGLTVKIGYGAALVNGHYYALENDGSGVKTLALSAPASKPRIDRIVLRLDETDGVRTVAAAVLRGEEADVPTPPALTRTDMVYEISLARVYLGVGASVINAENVTDERADAAVCGILMHTGLLAERGRLHLNVGTGEWVQNAQGVYEKTIDAAGTVAGNQAQRVEMSVAGAQIGKVMLAGGRVDTDGKLTLICLTAPDAAFELDVTVTEAM